MSDEIELTVSEAAARLATTEPRLRRLLQRPEFAHCARQVSRQTKTGTRTATAIPVSVLPRMQDALREVKPEHKREQEHAGAFPIEAYRVLSEAVIAEQAGRISDLQASVQDLRAERDRLLSDLEREREQTRVFALEAESLRQRLAITAETPPESRATAVSGAGETEEGTETSTRAGARAVRRWWGRWWGKRKERK